MNPVTLLHAQNQAPLMFECETDNNLLENKTF